MRTLQWALPLAAMLLALAACGNDDNGGSSGGSNPSVTFALTDAPSDQLSVFQVELTGVRIFDTAGAPTQVFPAVAGQTRVLNLLHLHGVHHLLGNLALPAGSYDKLEMSFVNAMAVDSGGTALTVNPSTSGTVTVLLQPALQVGASNLMFEIDFDVNNSVSNIVTGPGGSLTLNPVVIARVDDTPTGAQKVEDFKALVGNVSAMSMVVTLGAGKVSVHVTPTTVIIGGGTSTTGGAPGFSLTQYVSIGNTVEVDGSFNAAANAVIATQIEVEDGISGFNGPEATGLVLSIGAGTFDLLVTEARTSGFSPGSTQAVSFTGSSVFKWDDPDGAASSTNLRVGMEVRVIGTTGTPAAAQAVKLRETKLRGSVVNVNAGALQAVVNASHIEGVAVATFAGFSNPVTVQFTGSIPAGVAAASPVEVEGHFERYAPGIFSVTSGHGEDNHTHSLEGNTFSIVTASPLVLSITGQMESTTGIVNTTASVVLAGNVVIIEQNDDAKTSTMITAAALVAGINSGRYVELKAEGPHDSGTNTLMATKIVAEMN